MKDFLDFISQVIDGADCEMKVGNEWKGAYLYGTYSPHTIQVWYNEGRVRLKNKDKNRDKFLLFLEACLSGKQYQEKIESAWEDVNVMGLYHLRVIVERFNKGVLRIKPNTHMVKKGVILYEKTKYSQFGFSVCPMTLKMFKQEYPTCRFISFLDPVEIVEEEIDD